MSKWHEQRHAPAPGTYLCEAADINEGAVREFRFGGESPFAFRLFIYNDRGMYRAYRNSCPHYKVPLNHEPGKVFTPDEKYFLCMTHYAQFEKSSGLCVAGPCTGQSLETIPLQQEKEYLFVGEILE